MLYNLADSDRPNAIDPGESSLPNKGASPTSTRDDAAQEGSAGTFTAAQIIAAEKFSLFGDAGADSDVVGVGLSFSGGGIRSAAFGLGVFQALLSTPFFKQVDYLSTVSGGGYLGGAISWLRKLSADQYAHPAEALAAFEKEFGSAAVGIRSGDDAGRSRSGAPSTPTLKSTATKPRNADSDRQYVWLDYIRTHGNYLLPPGISYLGVGLTILRGTVFNLTVYGGLLTALFTLLIMGGVIPGQEDNPVPWGCQAWWGIDSWLFLGGVLFGASVLIYGIATWLASMSVAFSIASGCVLFTLLASLSYVLFNAELTTQIFGAALFDNARWPLAVAAAMVAVLVGYLTRNAIRQPKTNQYGRPNETWHYQSRVAYTDLLGGFCGILIGVIIVWSLPVVFRAMSSNLPRVLATATFSSVLGAIGGVYQFIVGRGKGSTATWLANLRVVASAVLLIYGLGLLAYAGATLLVHDHVVVLVVIAFASLVVGFFVNTNYLGLSRMYRDRIMEAFMPNAESIKANRWSAATNADATALVDLRTKDGGIRRPLHLINCNLVMIDSANDRFRGRGGDSFMLSPLYSGSDATGWVRTENLGDGELTLATAVAISGAAANPNAAVAGLGVTRNRLVSFLMSVLNIRLGYWLPNPKKRSEYLRRFWPNLWMPGLRQGLLGRGLHEWANFIELTDGGHFENTALYELIRRRVRVIVAVEAGQDKVCTLDDLANAIERARVDFGVHIRFDERDWDLHFLRWEEKVGLAARGFAIGTIRYPTIPQPEKGPPTYIDGVILYIQAIPVWDMRPDTQSYWRRHKDFPNEPTSNQFFEEEQLEAYRELGLRIGRSAISSILNAGEDPPRAALTALRELLS